MAKSVYLLNEVEWARIEPLLPKGRRGARRVDDRRIISGIVFMLRSGARWRDCLPRMVRIRPSTTASTGGANRACGKRFSRFCRTWNVRQTWPLQIPPTSRFTARRVAQKGGLRQCHRTLARGPHEQNPRVDRPAGTALRAVRDAGQYP